MAAKAIFVLDDDGAVLRSIDRLLKLHGYEVELFDSVGDFHKRAKLHEATCLIVDIHLNGVTGIDLRRQLGSSGFRIPVIFITADHSEATHTRAFEAGYMAYILKPFPAKQLLTAIRSVSSLD